MEQDFFDLFIESLAGLTDAQQERLRLEIKYQLPQLYARMNTEVPQGTLRIDTTSLMADPRTRRLAKAMAFMPGDRVRVIGNINPKYLLGMTGSVISDGKTIRAGTKQVRMSVKLDSPIGRFKALSPIGIPVECLEKL